MSFKETVVSRPKLALADAGPNARPQRGAPLSSDFMTSSCSVNRVTNVVERKGSTALTRELRTFANVREEICWF